MNSIDGYIYKICCDIVKKMIVDKKSVLKLYPLVEIAEPEERIVLNQTKSPDGAEGAFLLLRKKRFDWEKHSNEEVKKVLTQLKKENMPLNIPKEMRIQDFFEEFVYLNLKQIFKKDVRKACREHMNEYDIIVFLKSRNILIEVKSDKWTNTGNVSLEIIRECQKYKNDLDKMKENEYNIGSIIKTRADYWVVYYYDLKNKTFYSHIYWIPEVKYTAYKILKNLHNEFFKEKK